MREITEFAGNAAITVNGKRDPIFDGFTASGYRRTFTLSELTHAEKLEQAEKLLQERNGSTHDQALNIAGAASCYGGPKALDNLIQTLTR